MANALNYMANVGRSIKYSAIDVAKQMNPALGSFAETNGEIIRTTYDSIKHLKVTAKKIGAKGMENEYVESSRTLLKNLKDDLSTGNFYNRERIAKAEKNIMKNDFGLDDGFDDFNMDDFNDDSGSDDFDMGDMMDTVDKVGQKSTEAINNVMIRTAEFTAASAHEDAKANYGMSKAIYASMHSGMGTINKNISTLIDYATGPMTQHLENSKTYYETTTELAKERNSILSEMRDLMKTEYGKNNKSDDSKSDNITFSNVLDSEGMLNIEQYANYVKQNLKSVSSGVTDMISMLKETGALEMMLASPLQTVTEGIVKTLIPQVLKSATENLNNTLSGAFSSLMMKFTNSSKDGILKNIFGVKLDQKDNFDTSKYEKGAVPFDGVVRKSIVEVIPTYLAQIAAGVTGKNEKRYDFETGQFMDIEQISKKKITIDNMAYNQSVNPFKMYADAFMNNIKFGKDEKGKKQKDQFNKDLDMILHEMMRTGVVFNHNTNKDAASYGLKGGKASEINFEIIKSIFRSLPKELKTQFSNNYINAVEQKSAYLRQLEKSSDIISALFNGSLDNVVQENIDGNNKSPFDKLDISINNLDKSINNLISVITAYNSNHNTFVENINTNNELSSDNIKHSQTQLLSTIPMVKTNGLYTPVSIKTNNSVDNTIQKNYSKKYKKDELENKSKKKTEDLNSTNTIVNKKDRYQGLSEEEIKFLKEKDKLLENFMKISKGENVSYEDLLQSSKDNASTTANIAFENMSNMLTNNKTSIAEYLREYETNEISDLFPKFSEKHGGIFEKLADGIDVLQIPGKMLSDIINKVDTTIYDMIFGENGEKDKDNLKKRGIAGAVFDGLKNNFNQFKDWIKREMLDPVKKFFSKENLSKKVSEVAEVLGIENPKDKLKESFSKMKDSKTYKRVFDEVTSPFNYGKSVITKKADELELTKKLNEAGKSKKAYNKSLKETKNKIIDTFNAGPTITFADGIDHTPLSERNGVDYDDSKSKANNKKGNIPGYAKGKLVKETGLAVLSKGEAVVPFPYEDDPFNTTKGNRANITKQREKEEDEKRSTFLKFFKDAGFGDMTKADIPGFAKGSRRQRKKNAKKLEEKILQKKQEETVKESINSSNPVDDFLNDPKSFIENHASGKNKDVDLDSLLKEAKLRLANMDKDEAIETEKQIESALNDTKEQDYGEGDFVEGRSKNIFGKSLSKLWEGIIKTAGEVTNHLKTYNTDSKGKEVDPKKEKENLAKTITEQAKSYLPEMIGGSVLGTGISMITGVVGGPLVGTAVGAGVSLIKNSEKVQSALFGKIGEDGERDGSGLLSKEVSNWITKNVPAIGKGAMFGGIASLLPFVPGGPVTGIILGGAAGFALKSNKIHDALFGEGDSLFGPDAEKKLKEKLPNMGAGALAGMIAGPFGLIPNILLGSTLGYATTTNKFQDFMFGEEVDGKREGGFVKATVDGLFGPMIDFVKDQVKSLGKWAEENIKNPLERIVNPLKQGAVDMFHNISERVTGSINSFFEERIGAPLDKLIKEKVFGPLKKIGKGFLKGMLSPFKLLTMPLKGAANIADKATAKQIKQGRAGYLSAEQRLNFADKDIAKGRKSKWKDYAKSGQRTIDERLMQADSQTADKFSKVAEGITNFGKGINVGTKEAWKDVNEYVNHNPKLSSKNLRAIRKIVDKTIEQNIDVGVEELDKILKDKLVDDKSVGLSKDEALLVVNKLHTYIAAKKVEKFGKSKVVEERQKMLSNINDLIFEGKDVLNEGNISKFAKLAGKEAKYKGEFDGETTKHVSDGGETPTEELTNALDKLIETLNGNSKEKSISESLSKIAKAMTKGYDETYESDEVQDYESAKTARKNAKMDKKADSKKQKAINKELEHEQDMVNAPGSAFDLRNTKAREDHIDELKNEGAQYRTSYKAKNAAKKTINRATSFVASKTPKVKTVGKIILGGAAIANPGVAGAYAAAKVGKAAYSKTKNKIYEKQNGSFSWAFIPKTGEVVSLNDAKKSGEEYYKLPKSINPAELSTNSDLASELTKKWKAGELKVQTGGKVKKNDPNSAMLREIKANISKMKSIYKRVKQNPVMAKELTGEFNDLEAKTKELIEKAQSEGKDVGAKNLLQLITDITKNFSKVSMAHAAKGGRVTKTGVITVHEGETISGVKTNVNSALADEKKAASEFANSNGTKGLGAISDANITDDTSENLNEASDNLNESAEKISIAAESIKDSNEEFIKKLESIGTVFKDSDEDKHEFDENNNTGKKSGLLSSIGGAIKSKTDKFKNYISDAKGRLLKTRSDANGDTIIDDQDADTKKNLKEGEEEAENEKTWKEKVSDIPNSFSGKLKSILGIGEKETDEEEKGSFLSRLFSRFGLSGSGKVGKIAMAAGLAIGTPIMVGVWTDTIWPVLKPILEPLWNNIKGLFGGKEADDSETKKKGLFGRLGDAFKTTFNYLSDRWKSGMNTIVGFFTGTGEYEGKGLPYIFQRAMGLASKFITWGIENLLPQAVQTVVSVAPDLAIGLGKGVFAAVKGIPAAIGKIWSGDKSETELADETDGIFKSVSGELKFATTPNPLTEAEQKELGLTGTTFEDVYNSFKDAVSIVDKSTGKTTSSGSSTAASAVEQKDEEMNEILSTDESSTENNSSSTNTATQALADNGNSTGVLGSSNLTDVTVSNVAEEDAKTPGASLSPTGILQGIYNEIITIRGFLQNGNATTPAMATAGASVTSSTSTATNAVSSANTSTSNKDNEKPKSSGINTTFNGVSYSVSTVDTDIQTRDSQSANLIAQQSAKMDGVTKINVNGQDMALDGIDASRSLTKGTIGSTYQPTIDEIQARDKQCIPYIKNRSEFKSFDKKIQDKIIAAINKYSKMGWHIEVRVSESDTPVYLTIAEMLCYDQSFSSTTSSYDKGDVRFSDLYLPKWKDIAKNHLGLEFGITEEEIQQEECEKGKEIIFSAFVKAFIRGRGRNGWQAIGKFISKGSKFIPIVGPLFWVGGKAIETGGNMLAKAGTLGNSVLPEEFTDKKTRNAYLQNAAEATAKNTDKKIQRYENALGRSNSRLETYSAKHDAALASGNDAKAAKYESKFDKESDNYNRNKAKMEEQMEVRSRGGAPKGALDENGEQIKNPYANAVELDTKRSRNTRKQVDRLDKSQNRNQKLADTYSSLLDDDSLSDKKRSKYESARDRFQAKADDAKNKSYTITHDSSLGMNSVNAPDASKAPKSASNIASNAASEALDNLPDNRTNFAKKVDNMVDGVKGKATDIAGGAADSKLGRGMRRATNAASDVAAGAKNLGSKAWEKTGGRVTNGIRNAKDKIGQAKQNAIDKAKDLGGKAVDKLKNTKAGELATKAVSKLDNSLIGKFIKKVKDGLKKILQDEKVVAFTKKLFGDEKTAKKLGGTIAEKIGSAVTKHLGKAAGKMVTKITSKITTFMASGGIFGIVDGVLAFINGWRKSDSILGIARETTLGENIIGALANTLNEVFLLGIIPTSTIVQILITIFKHIPGKFGDKFKSLAKDQEAAQAELDEYNDKNHTNYDLEEYLRKVKYKYRLDNMVENGVEAVKDKVGGAVKGAGKAIGNAAKSAWNWITGADKEKEKKEKEKKEKEKKEKEKKEREKKEKEEKEKQEAELAELEEINGSSSMTSATENATYIDGVDDNYIDESEYGTEDAGYTDEFVSESANTTNTTAATSTAATAELNNYADEQIQEVNEEAIDENAVVEGQGTGYTDEYENMPTDVGQNTGSVGGGDVLSVLNKIQQTVYIIAKKLITGTVSKSKSETKTKKTKKINGSVVTKFKNAVTNIKDKAKDLVKTAVSKNPIVALTSKVVDQFTGKDEDSKEKDKGKKSKQNSELKMIRILVGSIAQTVTGQDPQTLIDNFKAEAKKRKQENGIVPVITEAVDKAKEAAQSATEVSNKATETTTEIVNNAANVLNMGLADNFNLKTEDGKHTTLTDASKLLTEKLSEKNTNPIKGLTEIVKTVIGESEADRDKTSEDEAEDQKFRDDLSNKTTTFRDKMGKIYDLMDKALGLTFGFTDSKGNIISLSKAIKNDKSKNTNPNKATNKKKLTGFAGFMYTFNTFWDDIKKQFVSLSKKSKSKIKKASNESIAEALDALVTTSESIKKSSASGSGIAGTGTGLKTGSGRSSKDGTFISQLDSSYARNKFNISGDTTKQTIGDSGCGPAAAAMVVNGIRGNNMLSMKQATEDSLKYKVKNQGVSADYFANEFKKHNMITDYMTGKDRNKHIANYLRSGDQVVLMGQDASNTSKKNSPFGPNAHYVVANGLSENGKKIYINDPEASKPSIEYDTSKVLGSSSMGIAGIGTDLTSPAKGSGILKRVSKYTGRGTIDLPGNSNREKIWNYFKSRGMCDIQTAAIIGNLMQESGCEPSIKQYGGGPGRGIVQWTDGSARYNGLVNLASTLGVDWTNLYAQLEWMWAEFNAINGSQEKQFGGGYENYLIKKRYGSVDAFLQNTEGLDIENAVIKFCKCYERAGKPNYDNRVREAQTAYNEFSGNTVEVTGLTSTEYANSSTGDSSGGVITTSSSNVVTGDLSSYTSSDKPTASVLMNAINIFQDLAKAYGLIDGDSSDESSSTDETSAALGGYAGGKITSDQKASYQQGLVDTMASVEGKLHYSQDKRDPDQGSGDCSSTVQWAYKKAIGEQDWVNVNPGSSSSDMISNATNGKNTYIVDGSTGMSKGTFNTKADEILEKGDILLYDGHAEMYAGNSTVWNNGGPGWNDMGTRHRSGLAKDTLKFAARWKGFHPDNIDDSVESSDTTANNGEAETENTSETTESTVDGLAANVDSEMGVLVKDSADTTSGSGDDDGEWWSADRALDGFLKYASTEYNSQDTSAPTKLNAAHQRIRSIAIRKYIDRMINEGKMDLGGGNGHTKFIMPSPSNGKANSYRYNSAISNKSYISGQKYKLNVYDMNKPIGHRYDYQKTMGRGKGASQYLTDIMDERTIERKLWQDPIVTDNGKKNYSNAGITSASGMDKLYKGVVNNAREQQDEIKAQYYDSTIPNAIGSGLPAACGSGLDPSTEKEISIKRYTLPKGFQKLANTLKGAKDDKSSIVIKSPASQVAAGSNLQTNTYTKAPGNTTTNTNATLNVAKTTTNNISSNTSHNSDNTTNGYLSTMINLLKNISSNTSNIKQVVSILTQIMQLQEQKSKVDTSTETGKQQAAIIDNRKTQLINTLKESNNKTDDEAMQELLKNVQILARS